MFGSMAILRAAILYWAAIFALGFVLGTVRVLWGAGEMGETAFILFEVPVMLAASWLVALWLVRHNKVRNLGAAGAIGALAFAMLMGAELLLARMMTGQSAGEWFAALWRVPHFYGTLGQVGFGVMPMVAWPSAKAR